MSYLALWLKGQEIIAEDEFDDLIEAKDFVLDHLQQNRHDFGVTGVRVCDDHSVFFQIECFDAVDPMARPSADRPGFALARFARRSLV